MGFLRQREEEPMTLTGSRLTIHMMASLDGFIARRDGRVDWMETSDEFDEGEALDPECLGPLILDQEPGPDSALGMGGLAGLETVSGLSALEVGFAETRSDTSITYICRSPSCTESIQTASPEWFQRG